jgi:hypothetical protein
MFSGLGIGSWTRLAARLLVASLLGAVAIPLASEAAPISVAGPVLPDGGNDFAREPVVVPGTVTDSSLSEESALPGGRDVAASSCVITSDVAKIDVSLGQRQILDLRGPDAVIFELSGDQLVGATANGERFDISAFRGLSRSVFGW